MKLDATKANSDIVHSKEVVKAKWECCACCKFLVRGVVSLWFGALQLLGFSRKHKPQRIRQASAVKITRPEQVKTTSTQQPQNTNEANSRSNIDQIHQAAREAIASVNSEAAQVRGSINREAAQIRSDINRAANRAEEKINSCIAEHRRATAIDTTQRSKNDVMQKVSSASSIAIKWLVAFALIKIAVEIHTSFGQQCSAKASDKLTGYDQIHCNVVLVPFSVVTLGAAMMTVQIIREVLQIDNLPVQKNVPTASQALLADGDIEEIS